MAIKSLDRLLVINFTLVTEALLLLMATFWSKSQNIRLAPLLVLHHKNLLIGIGAGLIMVATSMLLIWIGKVADRLSPDKLRWLSSMRRIIFEDLAPVFSQLHVLDIFIIAAVSGFCEEVFFRGVMQDQLGLVWTSIIFGVFHGPSLRHLSYGLWAAASGAFLGWILQQTGCLWAPIIAHALNNSISLLYIRYCIKPEVATE